MSMSDISFDRESGRFVGISDHDLDVWQRTWRTCDIRTLISIAEATVIAQPQCYAPTTIWRRWLCKDFFPNGRNYMDSIPLQIENRNSRIEKNPEISQSLGLVQGGGALDMSFDKHILPQLPPSLSTSNKVLMGSQLSDHFFKLNVDAPDMLAQQPALFAFLLKVAKLTWRSENSLSLQGLLYGQAFLLGPKDFGLTVAEYRARKLAAEKLKLLKFEGKNKGTIATWLDNRFLVLFLPQRHTESQKRQKSDTQNDTLDKYASDCKPKKVRTTKQDERHTERHNNDTQATYRSIYREREEREIEKKETKKVAALASADADRLVTLFFSDLAKRNAAAKKPSNLNPSLTAMQRLIDLHGLQCVEQVVSLLPETFYAVHVNTVLSLQKKFVQCCGYVQDLAGKDKAASLRPAKHASYTTAEGVSSIVDRMEIVE